MKFDPRRQPVMSWKYGRLGESVKQQKIYPDVRVGNHIPEVNKRMKVKVFTEIIPKEGLLA